MERTLQEQRALQKLGINSFREVGKNQIIELCSILDKVDPEVAKSIINQLPNFTTLMKDLSSDCRQSTTELLKQNDTSTDKFYESANKILDSIDRLLDQESCSDETKLALVDKQIEVLGILDAKDTENKNFINKACDFIQNNYKTMLGATGALVIAIVAKNFTKKN